MTSPATHTLRLTHAPIVGAFAVLVLAVSSCSVQRYTASTMANTLATGPDVFSTENDPELVRESVPFGLKTMEGLLQTLPEHRGLLLASCRGFTQYSFAFVQMDADEIEEQDYGEAKRLRARALNLYQRALAYGLRGLELDYPGITRGLRSNPDSAAARIKKEHVPALFWTAVAWGSAISLGRTRADLLADTPAVRALITRGMSLDEAYELGSFHEAMILLEALPASVGGSPDRAREHFERAIQLSGGVRAGPYVTLAQSVSIMVQDRAEFERLLKRALAIDVDAEPQQRLSNIILQRKAEMLLDRADEYFLEPLPDGEDES